MHVLHECFHPFCLTYRFNFDKGHKNHIVNSWAERGMMRISTGCNLLCFFLFLLVVAAVPSYAAENRISSDMFLRAYSGDGKIEIEASGIVNWRQVAPARYKNINVKHPPQSFLKILNEKRSESSSACYLDYSAPIPNGIKKSYFYLISADGITLLRVKSLHGVVRYDLDPDSVSIVAGPIFDGSIVLSVDGKRTLKSGFVLRSERPLSFTFTTVKIKVGDYPSILDMSREEIIRSLREGRAKWGIAHSFGFQINGDDEHYAFVEWAIDTDCAFNASLLVVGTSPHEVINNICGCDI
jgi:hypothetical protein